MRGAAILVLACACSFEHGRLPGATRDGDVTGDGARIDTATDASMRQTLFAYNIAGEAHSGTDFPGMWAADPGTICDGSSYQLAVDVQNTVDDPLFTRWQYSFSAINCALGTSLPPDEYEVTLVFGEIWIGPGCPYNGTARIFDIEIEGTVVEANVNTVAVGGCCHPDATAPGTPFKRVFTRTISDGTANITLRAKGNDQAMLNAIMLRR